MRWFNFKLPAQAANTRLGMWTEAQNTSGLSLLSLVAEDDPRLTDNTHKILRNFMELTPYRRQN